MAAAAILAIWLVGAGRKPANRLEEATAHLAAGRAGKAETALREAAAAEPANARARVLLLEILRVENRELEAINLGWEAFERVGPADRPAILRQITLACLTDVPDALARTTLNRWIAADPDDFEAETALLRRMDADPREEDPDRRTRVDRLEALVAAHPDQPNPRAALVAALADEGAVDRGRAILDAWPTAARDARYQRLLGRWELEYDRRVDRAVATLATALKSLPQDGPTRYRLASALAILGRRDEARRESATIARIRRALDPATLGTTLDAAFAEAFSRRREGPGAALSRLVELCRSVGLERLAQSWRTVGWGSAAEAGTTRPMPW